MTDLITQHLPFTPSILAGSISKSSMKMYERDFAAYLNYAQTPEIARKASTLARWRTQLVQHTAMSPNTINRMLAAVKRIMKEAATQDYIKHEEAEAFKHIDGVSVGSMTDRTRVRNRVRISPDNMRKIVESIDTTTLIGLRNRALFLTLASSGLRVNEFAQLKQEQIIKQDKGYLLHMYAEIGKNQREDRDAHISPEAVQAIQDWLAVRPVQSQYIFTSFAGRSNNPERRALVKPITPQGAWSVVKNIAEPFAPGVKPHDFRRFVGTQLFKKNPGDAQKALGHKRIETTTKYNLNEIEVGLTDHLF